MNYDEIDHLRAHQSAWSLLRSPNVALVMSFLGRVFIDRNVADVPAGVLAGELDDELYRLNQRLGEGRFPRTAAEYLDERAAPERGWLRKFYPPGSDEARYDVSPAVEKALMWEADLRSREFIGTGCCPHSIRHAATGRPVRQDGHCPDAVFGAYFGGAELVRHSR